MACLEFIVSFDDHAISLRRFTIARLLTPLAIDAMTQTIHVVARTASHNRGWKYRLVFFIGHYNHRCCLYTHVVLDCDKVPLVVFIRDINNSLFYVLQVCLSLALLLDTLIHFSCCFESFFWYYCLLSFTVKLSFKYVWSYFAFCIFFQFPEQLILFVLMGHYRAFKIWS